MDKCRLGFKRGIKNIPWMLYQDHLSSCSLTQISNEPVTWFDQAGLLRFKLNIRMEQKKSDLDVERGTAVGARRASENFRNC